MFQLYWELEVLSRAISYGNLSLASAHVGLSQPQLSRIVARIEEQLDVVLLDRNAPRKSGWTPIAHRLAERYVKQARFLEAQIAEVVEDKSLGHLRVGTLEGLVPLSSKVAFELLKSSALKVLELDVQDLNKLEEYFLKGEYDVIFTSREPGRKKFKHVFSFGHQVLSNPNPTGALPVLSTYEFGLESGRSQKKKHRSDSQALVSNSLSIRRQWISWGGSGQIPSDIIQGRPKKASSPVYLIGNDDLHGEIWTALVSRGQGK